MHSNSFLGDAPTPTGTQAHREPSRGEQSTRESQANRETKEKGEGENRQWRPRKATPREHPPSLGLEFHFPFISPHRSRRSACLSYSHILSYSKRMPLISL